MHWIEKWLTPFRIVMTFSISMQSLGEIEPGAPVVGAKIAVFCMSRLVCLRVGDIVQTSIVWRFMGRFWWGFQHFLGRLPKVDLIILEGENVRLSVRPSTKSFFDFNEIWYIGRGRRVMHDGMPYGRIQGQGQSHEPLKVWIPSIFKTYLLCHLQWELANDH